MTDPKEVRQQVSPDTFPTDQAAPFTLEGFYRPLIQGLTDKYPTVFEPFGREGDGAFWLNPELEWVGGGAFFVYTPAGIFEVHKWKNDAIGHGYEEKRKTLPVFKDRLVREELVAALTKGAKVEVPQSFDLKIGEHQMHAEQLALHSPRKGDRQSAISKLKKVHEAAVETYNNLQESERQRPRPEELLEEL